MLHKWSLAFIILLICKITYSLECNLKISGRVLDRHDKTALNFATLYILELGKGTAADSNGYFEYTSICPGKYSFIIEHIGCSPDTIKLNIDNSISKDFYLEHHAEELEEIVATATRDAHKNSQTINLIDNKTLTALQGKDLGSVLSTISGVNLLRTGSYISKPIIHGLYGDRVSIINNGVKLETQDWGSEHAPEVDPFAANIIKVIKGVGSLEYGSDAMGGMVLMEPPLLQKNKHLKFNLSLAEQTNGRGTTTSAKIEQGFQKPVAYFIQGTFKEFGDQQTPQYNLSNTGLQEGNFSGEIGFLKKGWDVSTYYSLFHQELAILKSSHIGNLTDLKNAIASNQPLIINPFSFALENPKQRVTHHLGKLHITKYFKNQGQFDLTYSIQINQRKEYDIRRGGRSSIPALDMQLSSNNLLGTYQRTKTFERSDVSLEGKSGFSFLSKHNANNPATGIRPLIPDYYQYNFGVFDMEKLTFKSIVLEAGLRYDYTRFLVYKFDKQNNLLEPKYNFHTYAVALGTSWNDKKDIFLIQSNLSLSSRFPNASELFSEGLHHGIAALEFGNANLKPETGIKWVNTISIKYRQYLQTEATFYVSKIHDFIYLAPLPEPVLTIRGAFPAFQYYQTDARLLGLDITINSQPFQFLSLSLRSSIIRGKNRSTKDNLIYMPSDKITASLNIHHDFKKISNLHFGINTEHVFKQINTPSLITDYKATPNAYTVLNAEAGLEYCINTHHTLSFSVSGENITNATYRDYLNRFRYYADELGWNLIIRLRYTFNQ